MLRANYVAYLWIFPGCCLLFLISMGLRMSDWFQFLRAAMKTVSLLLPRTNPELLQTLELLSMSSPKAADWGRPFLGNDNQSISGAKGQARCVLKAVTHHRHRHHCLVVSSPCHMSNINGMIMSGRTQLCKGAVGSFRHVFWVFLGLFAIQTIQFEHAWRLFWP